MVSLRQSGSGTLKFTWQGATVKQQINADVNRALNDLASEIRAFMQGYLHEITGRMKRESFAYVEIRGGKRTLVVGSDAPYTLFHELRYHAQFREIADTFAPKVTPTLQKALNGG